jgi:predicted ATP-grasp superfamily ATP-dependent carboligase
MENGLNKPSAIVIGLDSMNGIQTARILAEHDIPVIAVAKDPDHPFCKTNVCEKIFHVDTSSVELIDLLVEIGPTLDHKAVLFPCNDMNVYLISQYRERLEDWFFIIMPIHDTVDLLMNKTRFYKFAKEKGFPIPKTYFLAPDADIDQIAKELTFPCILKPPISATPEWETKSKMKAYKIIDLEELQNLFNKYGNLAENLILQEWIDGPETNLYSCNCYFDHASNPQVTFVARKLRQWPPITGESSLGEECRNDSVLDITIRLFSEVSYSGLGYVEIKQDARDGNYYIMEPNVCRPTGRSAISEAGGVELIYTMYCDALGWGLPNNRTQNYGSAKWIYLRRDLQSAVFHWKNGDLTAKDWINSLRGHKRFALFSWSDPYPFIGDIIRSIRLYLSPEERKKRDYRKKI